MKDLRVSIVQANLHWEQPEQNRLMFDHLLTQITPGSTDLIVLPEMFSTGFSMEPQRLAEPMNGPTMQWMRAQAAAKQAMITGSLMITENGLHYNRLIWMRPDGSFESYDKRHLFRYANEQDHYTAGNSKLVMELKGWKICPLVCYDLRFPAWIRNRYQADGEATYDLLLFVANWPARRSHPWKTLLMARAMENQCYTVGVNRIGEDGKGIAHSGDSVVLDPKGEALSRLQANEAGVETVHLSYDELINWRKTFPAWMDADDFNLK